MGGRSGDFRLGSWVLIVMFMSAAGAMAAPASSAVEGVAASAAERPFHSAQYGYNLTLPANWEQMPPEVVHEVMSKIQNPNVASPLVNDAAFQAVPHTHWFEYPYFVVQVLPYANVGLHRQINEDEFDQVIQAITGANIKKVMDKNLTSTARARMSDPTLGQPSLDRDRRRFQMPISMTVKGAGNIKGTMVGYFGHEALVQIAFSAKENDWDRQASSCQSILDSFHFDPDKDYSVVAAIEHPSSQSIWHNVGQNALEYGIAGGLIGMFCYLVTKIRKSKV